MNKILKFEAIVVLVSLIIILIARLIVHLIDNQLLQDGNLLVLLVFPLLLLMLIFNILNIFVKHLK
jgi:hypothetical protein